MVQERNLVRRILSAYENSPGKQDKGFVSTVCSKHRAVFGICLHAPPRYGGYECFLYINSLQLAICSLCICHMIVQFISEYKLSDTLNKSLLYERLSLTHSFAPFSQVPLPLE